MQIDDENEDGTSIFRETPGCVPEPSWRTFLMGYPLSNADAPHQRIGKAIGLAVFASDALSSTAYATQEMLVILALAGSAAFSYSMPLAVAIVTLLIILTLSYEQTIHAYPGGGGAYIVSRDNLGELPAQIAAAALLTDYILTVAVSVSSGVAQLVSAYPLLFPLRAWVGVLFVFFIMLVNLRGVKESGMAFALPTFFFIVLMTITVMIGVYSYFTGSLKEVSGPPQDMVYAALQPLTLFLLLRSFASGTTALTGVEAISNGITAFKEPSSRNAGITLIWMSCILGFLLLGITFLSHQIGALPSEEETVISQLARTVFESRGFFYLALISATTVILVMAANTAFADFPRLGALVAADGFLPRQLANRGSRLVFSRGIIVLALIASALILVFDGSVTRLIPLYAIGVFLSFTLSQAGMARRWRKVGLLPADQEVVERGSTLRYESGWKHKMIINGLGAICTLVVMMVFAVTKFGDGAWIIVILIPILVLIFFSIHRHYSNLAKKLSLENFGALPRSGRHRVIITVGGVHQGTLAALRYAHTLTDDITAVHISMDSLETEKIERKWSKWGDGVRLVILESPYRLFIEPLLEYIKQIDDQRQPNETITVIVPQFVSSSRWSSFLHARTAETLRDALIVRKGIVVTEVPYQVDNLEKKR